MNRTWRVTDRRKKQKPLLDTRIQKRPWNEVETG